MTHKPNLNNPVIGLVVETETEVSIIHNFFDDYSNTTHGVDNLSEPYRFYETSYNGFIVVIVVSGYGKVNSAIATHELIKRYNPEMIISLGQCVAFDFEDLQIRDGDIIEATQCSYSDVYYGNSELGRYVRGQIIGCPKRFRCHSLNLDSPDVHPGMIVSGDGIIEDGDTSEIRRHFPSAIAYDVSTTSIAQVCEQHHIPFSSVRVVMDVLDIKLSPDEDLDEISENMYQSTICQILDAILGNPWQVDDDINENSKINTEDINTTEEKEFTSYTEILNDGTEIFHEA